MATIYTEMELANGGRYTNTTGAALIENEFLVMAGKCLKACEAMAIAAIGGFEKLSGKVVQAATFVVGELTFATANLPVYWKPTTGEFSNKSTIGYYLVGYSIEAIAGGVVRFEACEPVLVKA